MRNIAPVFFIACSVLVFILYPRSQGEALPVEAGDLKNASNVEPPELLVVERKLLVSGANPAESDEAQSMLPIHYREAYQAFRKGGNRDWEAVAWWRTEPELLEQYLAVLNKHLQGAPEGIEASREAMRLRGDGVESLASAIACARPKRFPGPDALEWKASDFPGITDWSAAVLSGMLYRQRDHRIEHGMTPIDSAFSTFTNEYFMKHPLLFPPDQALIVLARDKSFRDWPDHLLQDVRYQAAHALIESVRLKDTYNALSGAFILASEETGFPVPSGGMSEVSEDWAAYQAAIPLGNSLYLLSLQGILQSYGIEIDTAVLQ